MEQQNAHVVTLSGGCVDGVWSIVLRCSCGWHVYPPKPRDAERAERQHRQEIAAA